MSTQPYEIRLNRAMRRAFHVLEPITRHPITPWTADYLGDFRVVDRMSRVREAHADLIEAMEAA